VTGEQGIIGGKNAKASSFTSSVGGGGGGGMT